MAYSSPTFVFVPGTWHLPQCFDLVRAQLEAQGFATEAVKTPSVGVPETGGAERQPGLDADCAAVRDVVCRLADEGKQVVLCVHSYGGLPGANALGATPDANGANVEPAEKLGFKHRAAAGKPGGVIMLVFITAIVVHVGRNVYNELGDAYLPWMDVKEDTITAIEPIQRLYHDVSPEMAKEATKALVTHSKRAYLDKASYEPWNDGVNCAYVVCDDDQTLPPAYQEVAVGRLGPDVSVFHINTGHSPFLNKPKELADLLVQAGQVGQARC